MFSGAKPMSWSSLQGTPKPGRTGPRVNRAGNRPSVSWRPGQDYSLGKRASVFRKTPHQWQRLLCYKIAKNGINLDLHQWPSVFSLFPTFTIASSAGTSSPPRSVKAYSTGVGRRAAHIERSLADGRAFLLGDTFTVADAYAFVVLNWAGFVGVSLDAWPKTQAYLRLGSFN